MCEIHLCFSLPESLSNNIHMYLQATRTSALVWISAPILFLTAHWYTPASSRFNEVIMYLEERKRFGIYMVLTWCSCCAVQTILHMSLWVWNRAHYNAMINVLNSSVLHGCLIITSIHCMFNSVSHFKLSNFFNPLLHKIVFTAGSLIQ